MKSNPARATDVSTIGQPPEHDIYAAKYHYQIGHLPAHQQFLSSVRLMNDGALICIR